MIWYHSGGFVFAIKSEDTVGKSKHTWTALTAKFTSSISEKNTAKIANLQTAKIANQVANLQTSTDHFNMLTCLTPTKFA